MSNDLSRGLGIAFFEEIKEPGDLIQSLLPRWPFGECAWLRHLSCFNAFLPFQEVTRGGRTRGSMFYPERKTFLSRRMAF
jgi:hypothetical protein